jgi:hypothetical protein
MREFREEMKAGHEEMEALMDVSLEKQRPAEKQQRPV